MIGNAKQKRTSYARKKGWRPYLHFSIKSQKKNFQRKFRNGKIADIAMRGNAYRKIINEDAKWHLAP